MIGRSCSTRVFRAMVSAILAAMGLASATAGRADEVLPEGPGLAARYPGDAGIERSRSVLLAEGFEASGMAELARRWNEVKNPRDEALQLVDDVPSGSAGRRSIEMTARPAEDTGGHLYALLPRAVDKAFARFYVKFPSPPGYIHHFVHFGGYEPPTRWPQGGAGQRPRGDERITVGIEPTGESGRHKPPGVWNFYAYWHEMKISADGRYWGNGLHPVEPPVVSVDRWQCVETMLKLNTPGRRDGELALWIDGKLVAHFLQGAPRDRWTGMGFRLVAEGGEPFEGFSFRTDEKLKINFFWLLHYVTQDALRRNRAADPTAPVRVRFDHVVVATDYIGPIQPE